MQVIWSWWNLLLGENNTLCKDDCCYDIFTSSLCHRHNLTSGHNICKALPRSLFSWVPNGINKLLEVHLKLPFIQANQQWLL